MFPGPSAGGGIYRVIRVRFSARVSERELVRGGGEGCRGKSREWRKNKKNIIVHPSAREKLDTIGPRPG